MVGSSVGVLVERRMAKRGGWMIVAGAGVAVVGGGRWTFQTKARKSKASFGFATTRRRRRFP